MISRLFASIKAICSLFRLYERDPFTNKPIKSRPMPEGTELTLPSLSTTTTTTLLMPGPTTNTTYNTLHPHPNGCASLIFPNQSMTHTVSSSLRSSLFHLRALHLLTDDHSSDGKSFSSPATDLFLSFTAQRQCLVIKHAFRADIEHLFQCHQSSISTTVIFLQHSSNDDDSSSSYTVPCPTLSESVSSIGSYGHTHPREPSDYSIEELTNLFDFIPDDKFTASQYEYVGSKCRSIESIANQIIQSEVGEQWHCRTLHWRLCHSRK